MRIELFNNGTCKITKGVEETMHTYVMNPRQDRTLYILDIDGGVVERKTVLDADDVDLSDKTLTMSSVMEQQGPSSTAVDDQEAPDEA